MTEAIISNYLSANIMMLNDECLNCIVGYLRQTDRFNFALTCSRFLNFYKQVSPKLDKTLILFYFNSNDAIHFMKLFGGNVKTIESFLETKSEVLDVLDIYCINLNVICVQGILEFEKIRAILPRLNNLQKLNISLMDYYGPYNVVSSCYFDAYNYWNCNRPYQLPISLRSLSLVECLTYYSSDVLKLCKFLPQLKELTVEMLSINDSDLRNMISENWFESLESLSINIRSDNKELEHIAKLPGLKKLVLACYEFDSTKCNYIPVPKRLLMMLVEHKSQQLEYFSILSQGNIVDSSTISFISKLSALRVLKIPDNKGVGNAEIEQLQQLKELEEIDISDCCNIGNKSVLNLILACPKLQVLRLGEFSLCGQLTKKLLTNIISNLSYQSTAQRTLPIKICIKIDAELRSKQLLSNIDYREIIDLKIRKY